MNLQLLVIDFEGASTGRLARVEGGALPGGGVFAQPRFAEPGPGRRETGIEFGLDWRIGTRTWIHLSDEIGRRQYESAQVETVPVDETTAELDDLLYSDYVYNRLTLLVTSEVTRGVAANLFVNWQPEDHRVSSHDTDTRIISGGLEYRF